MLKEAAAIQYSTTDSELENNLGEFRTKWGPTVSDLLGGSVTLVAVWEFVIATEKKMPGVLSDLDLADFIQNKSYDAVLAAFEDYLREATAPQVDSTITLTDPEHQYGYGYQFWRSRFGFSCRGMGSQLAVCVPEHDLILVTTADTQSITGGDSIIYDALERFILGSLSRGPLPEDPAAQSALQARISGLVLRAVSGERQSPQAAAIDGRTYVMDENGMGLKTVRFHVGADSIAMAYENATGPHEIRFGLGRQVRQSFPETHYYGRTMMRPSGRGYDCHASAAWRRDDSLLMVVYATDEYFGTLRMNAVFAGDTVTLQSDAFAEMFFNEYRGFASGRMRG